MARPDRPGAGRSTYENVYYELRNQVAIGAIAPGTRLLEVEIAERLEVSRTPVREALRRLESDGFAQRVQGRGLVVTPMGPDDLNDIGLLRVEIDGLAGRLASARASAADWANVRALVDAMVDCTTEEELARAHREAHRAIYAIGFSPRMSTFFDNHLLPHIEQIVNVGPGAKSDAKGSHHQHVALIRALSSGDVDRAVKAAREHAESGVRYAKQTGPPAPAPGPGAPAPGPGASGPPLGKAR